MRIEALEWSAATAAMPGETESGDRHVVCTVTDGALFAVLDGLGHGAQAACAANVATTALKRHAESPLTTIMAYCHESLRSTRGITMSLAAINTRLNSMTWVGVGNVEGLLRRAKPRSPDEKLLLRNGVVGAHLPFVQPMLTTLAPGDVLMFTTDGIAHDSVHALPMLGELQGIADTALARGNKGTDDALVLLVRYRGNQS
ncbi:MAG: SpoIIE family protein phosphatase [Steroidobacterales bacterium]